MDSANEVSAILENTPCSSARIDPIRLKTTGDNHFEVVQVRQPALKINIVAPNLSRGKSVPCQVKTTRNDGSSTIKDIVLSWDDRSIKRKQPQQKKESVADGKICPGKNKKKEQWRWIYIKQMEPSKQLVICSHRFREYPVKRKQEGTDFKYLENQIRLTYPNTQFHSDF